jgi:hypothetical protein
MAVPIYTRLSDLLHRKMMEIYDKGLILSDIDDHIKYGDTTLYDKVVFPEIVLIRPTAARTLRFHDHSVLEVECSYSFSTERFSTMESSEPNTEVPFLELLKVELHYTGKGYALPTQFVTRFIKLIFQNTAKQLLYTTANKVVIL